MSNANWFDGLTCKDAARQEWRLAAGGPSPSTTELALMAIAGHLQSIALSLSRMTPEAADRRRRDAESEAQRLENDKRALNYVASLPGVERLSRRLLDRLQFAAFGYFLSHPTILDLDLGVLLEFAVSNVRGFGRGTANAIGVLMLPDYRKK